jgi:hypothetical protein
MVTNELLAKLIKFHLDNANYHNKDVVVEAASLFLLFEDDFVDTSTGLCCIKPLKVKFS